MKKDFRFSENIISLKKLNDVYEKFRMQLHEVKLPIGFSEFLLYVLSEMFSNISEHSEATGANALVIIRKLKCVIEIRGNGIGLRSSYQKKGIYPKDDFAAIEFALSGLSTKNFKERGFGFYSEKNLFQEIRDNYIFTPVKQG